MRLLLIEDNAPTAKAIGLTLRRSNYICDTTDLGEDGIELAKLYDYNALVVDVALPDIDGFEIVRRLRDARIETPILMLSGYDGSDDKVKALRIGADDYLTKPYDGAELIARIQAVVRRMQGYSESVITVGNVAVDIDSKTVEVSGQLVRLTPKEYAVLELMVLRGGRTISKDMFMNHLYDGLEEPQSKIVDVFVCKLRSKLAKVNCRDCNIETVWGQGFRLQGVVDNPSPVDVAYISGGQIPSAEADASASQAGR